MTLKVGSLFDGIFGGGMGAEQAGMQVVWRSEIDPACNTLMDKHRPDIPNLGDVRGVGEASTTAVDVVIGGFPCQDLSVAGKRKGFAGERSGLWFEFHRVLAELKPGWVVIENVPGLLSSCGCIDCQTVRRIMRIHGWLRKRSGGKPCPVCVAGGRMLKSHRGRDFAVLLRGLVELGYGVSWRVLDAQYFGLAQRRKRVFIIGHLGDGAAAEVLFEREGGTRDTPPSRKARQGSASASEGGAGSLRESGEASSNAGRDESGTRSGSSDDGGVAGWEVAAPLTKGSASGKGVNAPGRRQEDDVNLVAYNIQNNDGGSHKRKDRPEGGMYVQETDTALTVGTTDLTAVVSAPLTARHSGESDKWPPINEADNLIAFDDRVITSPGNRSGVSGETSPTLGGEGSVHVAGAVSSKWAKGTGGPAGDEAYNLTVAPTLGTKNDNSTGNAQRAGPRADMAQATGAVRRLTPTECERLQGFPDGWTEYSLDGGQCVIIGEWLKHFAGFRTVIDRSSIGSMGFVSCTISASNDMEVSIYPSVMIPQLSDAQSVTGRLASMAQEVIAPDIINLGSDTVILCDQNGTRLSELREPNDAEGITAISLNLYLDGPCTKEKLSTISTWTRLMTPQLISMSAETEVSMVAYMLHWNAQQPSYLSEDCWSLRTASIRPQADGPRYRQLGNAWAVPVAAWILRRIAEISK